MAFFTASSTSCWLPRTNRWDTSRFPISTSLVTHLLADPGQFHARRGLHGYDAVEAPVHEMVQELVDLSTGVEDELACRGGAPDR